MKLRIFIPGTIILIIIVLLGFFIGCTVSNDDPTEPNGEQADPTDPGGVQDYVGTWVEIDPGNTKKVLTFTVNTFVDSHYNWDGSAWVFSSSLRGTVTVDGDQMNRIVNEISHDNITWVDFGGVHNFYTYSISDNQMTVKNGPNLIGVYTKQ